MYSQVKACVKVKNGLRHFFNVILVHVVSSPIIFALFINDLISYLRSECE